MSSVESVARKKELKKEILKTHININSILSEIENKIDYLQHETNSNGRLAVCEQKARASFDPVIEMLRKSEIGVTIVNGTNS